MRPRSFLDCITRAQKLAASHKAGRISRRRYSKKMKRLNKPYQRLVAQWAESWIVDDYLYRKGALSHEMFMARERGRETQLHELNWVDRKEIIDAANVIIFDHQARNPDA